MSDLRERLIEAVANNRYDMHTKPFRFEGAVDAILPIIEAELQKRDQEIERLKSDLEELRDQGCEYCDASVDDRIVAVEGEPDDFVGQFKNWWQCGQCVNKWSRDIKGIIDESKRLREVNTEANKLLEQTIEVLGCVPYNFAPEAISHWHQLHAKPLLDNLKAREKNHGSA